MPDGPSSKALLRKQMRQQRQALDPAAQLAAAEAVALHITQLPHWSDASRIALYMACDGEIDTAPLIAGCLSAGKNVFLPVIRSQNLLEFAAWREGDTLVANRYGIPEPGPEAQRCTTAALDIIALPLVAWDQLGGRLGMGAGFYDRALAGTRGSLLVGLAHSLQELPEVPRDDWDVPLDFVVTEVALHCCQGAN